MKEEKDKWIKTVRSKLYDFEVDTSPDDWEKIAEKLIVRHSFRHYYMAAAATVALLIVGGLGWYYGIDSFSDTGQAPVTATVPASNTPENSENSFQAVVDTVPVIAPPPAGTFARRQENKGKSIQTPVAKRDAATTPPLMPAGDILAGVRPSGLHKGINIPQSRSALVADASAATKRRRWGFGAGGGGYAAASNGDYAVLRYYPGNAPKDMPVEYALSEREPVIKNAAAPAIVGVADNVQDIAQYATNKTPTGSVKHKTPISFGLGASYYLNDRWALQSGLVYTMLRSEWTHQPVANRTERWNQRLHFIGIPLSASYSIAKWRHIQFYASAGGMCELNIAGDMKLTTEIDKLSQTESDKIRMTAPLWSLNASAGVSYPLWRFIHLYAEAGTSYYFDNRSGIETIRSYKPFNVSLQGGIRLGF